MRSRSIALVAITGLLLGAITVWVVSRAFLSPEPSGESPAPAVSPSGDASDVAHIRATLFYAGADGAHLVPLTREVRLAEGVDHQAREILTAAFEAPPPPMLPVIPPGTTLRGFFVTEGGDAFVDLSNEAISAHPGGSTAELLTIYSIVNAITVNLPTVKRVQILVDGRELDTLAGHVDLRHPLEPTTTLVRDEVH